ncbi:MAG: hypothetical protein JOY81_06325, partial [Alphaproteobacteria bacterium]|nr:hypothetical protein [Alphaproteobacteria bacterium]
MTLIWRRLAGLQGALNVAIWLLIAAGAATDIALGRASLRWEYAHDTPLLQYAGLLISKFGMVPYRDFFENSMPGAYAFHALIVWLFGAGNLAFALVNLGCLAVLLIAAWFFVARLDRVTASFFVAWYALTYLATGPTVILQRDFLTELPIATAMALVANGWPRGSLLRAALVGVLFGMAATIKPQLALGAPLVVIADILLSGRKGRGAVGSIAASLAGFAVPLAGCAIWLVAAGGWSSFVEVMIGYLPIYLGQTGEHVFLPPDERRRYLFQNGILFGWYWRLMIVALVSTMLALWLSWRDARKRVLIGLAAAMMILYGLIPILAGQFWNYHYLPLAFFVFMTLSFLLLPLRDLAVARWRALVAAGALAWSLHNNLTYQNALQWGPNEAQGGRVARIVKALSATLQPGETVQPVDGTEGVIHA